MQTEAASETLSKGAFALEIGKSAARVSQYIKAGKISGAALTPDGRVVVAIAKQQLRARLDPSQRLANGGVHDDEDDDVGRGSADQRYLDAKAEEKELEVERRRRQLKTDSGAWLDADEAKRAFARELAAVFTDIDAELTAIGDALAGKFGLEARALTLALRAEFNAFRARQANKKRAFAEEQPALQAAE
jgi:hypothetical protein